MTLPKVGEIWITKDGIDKVCVVQEGFMGITIRFEDTGQTVLIHTEDFVNGFIPMDEAYLARKQFDRDLKELLSE